MQWYVDAAPWTITSETCVAPIGEGAARGMIRALRESPDTGCAREERVRQDATRDWSV